MESLLLPAINLAILLGVLGYYLRAPMRSYVTGRHDYLRDEIGRVREGLEKATRDHADFSARLAALDAEVAALRDQARRDAAEAKQRIAAEARRLSETIVTDSRSSATSMLAELKGELRSELGNQVVSRAEAIIRERLTSEDRKRIRKEFSNQLSNGVRAS